jgi:hypothetical protein
MCNTNLKITTVSGATASEMEEIYRLAKERLGPIPPRGPEYVNPFSKMKLFSELYSKHRSMSLIGGGFLLLS